MAFEKQQSNKSSFIPALLSALIHIVFLPVWLIVLLLYEAHVILSSRKLGVSATALAPMSTRWLQHQLGLRRDEACAKLIKVLPNHTDDWLDNLAKAGFDPRKPTFFLWEGVTYYLSREAMEKAFRAIATIALGSVVVFDYATDAVNKMQRKPLGRLHKAILKTSRESQTFWIPSDPPVKETLATLM